MNSALPYRRPERVAQQILQIIGEIAARNVDLSFLGFVTFTKVRISSDLKHAKVFFSVLRPVPDVVGVANRLNELSPAFRKYLGPQLHIRFTPELVFIHDEGPEYAEKIEQLFERLHTEQSDGDT